MPFIVWTSEMSVGVKMLDNDHKKLAILINDLHEGLMAGRDSEALEHIFDELVAYTRLHFAHEEQLLAKAGYDGVTAHKKEHEQGIDQALMLQARFKCATEAADYLIVLDQLKDWLFKHTQGANKAFVEDLKATEVEAILAAWKEPE
ncbi:MAG: bacteriohemerythrin [Terracidiphilus sp.]|jgi:hemerythrin